MGEKGVRTIFRHRLNSIVCALASTPKATAFDKVGNVVQTTDAKSHNAYFTYDARSQKLSYAGTEKGRKRDGKGGDGKGDGKGDITDFGKIDNR